MTIDVRMVQTLLQALGCSPGAIDGIWGSRSQAALEAALKQCGARAAADFWGDIRWFRREEFRCKCAGKYCSGFESEMQEPLLRIADSLREECGAPAHVTSGLRCRQHNAETPGAAENSAHITGRAMDFYVEGYTAAQLLEKIAARPEIAYSYAVTDRVVHMNI